MPKDDTPRTTHDIAATLLQSLQPVAKPKASPNEGKSKQQETEPSPEFKTQRTQKEIAQSLSVKAPPQEEEEVVEEVVDEVEDDEAEGGDNYDESEYEDGDEGSQSDEDDDEAEEGDEGEEADDDSASYVELSDDDQIEVMVGDKAEMMTIAELKALANDKETLAQAKDVIAQSNAEYAKNMAQYNEANQSFHTIVSELENKLFSNPYQKPSAELKKTNPTAYNQQLSNYHDAEDQIAAGKKEISAMVNKQREAAEKARADYAKTQAAQLQKVIPDLSDKEKGTPLLKGMLETAQAYGFTMDEINDVLDHRYYVMVRDLARYQNARKGVHRKAETVKNLEGQSTKQPRKLRSGASALKSRAKKNQAQQKRATETARQSGKVKDVAKTLLKKG